MKHLPQSKHPTYFLLKFVYRVEKETINGVSLIAGLEYGKERWNGKWNGTVNVHNYS